MITYCGYKQNDGEFLLLYRVTRNADGLMTALDGMNATTNWEDLHEALELVENDPSIVPLTQEQAQQVAKGFGKIL